ncbi:MAG TPA: ATP-dependent helicase [Myxococcota bacterium]|nr:ATP-dependent helicase [Myxococcota bacterium]
MIDLLSLNESQRAAVLWDRGPLLVLAGPGSGKTRVLTYRIARILEASAGQYFRILALTFTNKAAAEMRGRVEELVPSELSRVRLTTFHSYAAELLQQHGSHLGIRPDFQILSNEADREALLNDVLRQTGKDLTCFLPSHFQASQILPAINRLLEQCVPADEAEAWLQRENVLNATVLARVYTAYREELRITNALDFPSLIAEALELLTKYSFLQKHIRKVYTHILVDEFQDTNGSQYEFLLLLTEPDPSTLFVVADDDQIIYQWNGASPERIEALRQKFQVRQLQLPENYRCPPQVIEMANVLISNNPKRAVGKQPLQAVKQAASCGVVRAFDFPTLDDEARWIAQDILQRSPDERKKCAVLARTNKLLEEVGQALDSVGIPVYYAARKDEFESAPFRMLHAILRLVNTREDKRALAQLSRAFYELKGINIDQASVLLRASADGTDLLRSWLDKVERHDALDERTRQLLGIDIMLLLNSLNYQDFAERFIEWAKASQLTPRPDEEGFHQFEEERKVWRDLLVEISKKFEGHDVSLHQLLHELDLTSKRPPKPDDAVPCFTIHASKGMEFGHVYLMGLVEDQLPSWAAVKKGDDSIEMQEERRNCFVAITRSQESLTLTFSDRVFGRSKQPSRFLREMGIELNEPNRRLQSSYPQQNVLQPVQGGCGEP